MIRVLLETQELIMDTHDARAAMASNAASGTISFSSEVYGVLKFDPVGVGIGGSGSATVGMNHLVDAPLCFFG